ncbi:hypothetical protein SBV1_2540022 [Verrucomicrobia bacterium]|nr:hypothetical protein SBV1_2540022 [Verrucomicrobiota bacterium]
MCFSYARSRTALRRQARLRAKLFLSNKSNTALPAVSGPFLGINTPRPGEGTGQSPN